MKKIYISHILFIVQLYLFGQLKENYSHMWIRKALGWNLNQMEAEKDPW